jgi:hypothetical protein
VVNTWYLFLLFMLCVFIYRHSGVLLSCSNQLIINSRKSNLSIIPLPQALITETIRPFELIFFFRSASSSLPSAPVPFSVPSPRRLEAGCGLFTTTGAIPQRLKHHSSSQTTNQHQLPRCSPARNSADVQNNIFV